MAHAEELQRKAEQHAYAVDASEPGVFGLLARAHIPVEPTTFHEHYRAWVDPEADRDLVNEALRNMITRGVVTITIDWRLRAAKGVCVACAGRGEIHHPWPRTCEPCASCGRTGERDGQDA